MRDFLLSPAVQPSTIPRMHLHPTSLCILLGVGFLAGILNAMAGGGTLVIFPTLVLLGMNPITANASSTVALIFGIWGSFWGYRRQLSSTIPWLRALLLPSALGGLLGGILLTQTPARVFEFLAPYLILFATVIFMVRNFFVRELVAEIKQNSPRPKWLAAFSQFFISLYGGYFGAGIGILMLASLSLMGIHNLIEINALKTVLGGAINLTASFYFIWKGLVDWLIVMILTLGALPGYYTGAVFAQRIPVTLVRHIIVIIGIILAAATLIQQIVK